MVQGRNTYRTCAPGGLATAELVERATAAEESESDCIGVSREI
jgi:hypothetical protein